jgi:hypothetical protein
MTKQEARLAAFKEQDRLYTKYGLDEYATLIDLERLITDEEFATLQHLMKVAGFTWKWERKVREDGPIQP